MITTNLSDSSKKVLDANGFAEIASVKGERFDRSRGTSGLNGKNIVLTGKYEIREFEGTPFVNLEVIYFTDSPENGKIGNISSSSFRRSFFDQNKEQVSFIPEFSELSEREVLAELMKPNVYLQPLKAVSGFRTEFVNRQPNCTDKKSIFWQYRLSKLEETEQSTTAEQPAEQPTAEQPTAEQPTETTAAQA